LPVPALVALLGDRTQRPRRGLEPREGLEPLDAAEAVAATAGRLRGGEVIEKDTGGIVVEAERREPGPRLVRRQAAASW
jgi:hypothetical protein